MKKNYFNKINDYVFSLLKGREILKTGMWGENSQFIRLNNSKVRQTGIIDDMSFSLCLIENERQATCSLTITGNFNTDCLLILNLLNNLINYSNIIFFSS